MSLNRGSLSLAIEMLGKAASATKVIFIIFLAVQAKNIAFGSHLKLADTCYSNGTRLGNCAMPAVCMLCLASPTCRVGHNSPCWALNINNQKSEQDEEDDTCCIGICSPEAEFPEICPNKL